jgi:aspartate-semialdehyde dehydrogenase
MAELRLGIVGATGVVGNEIIKIIQERKMEFKDIKLLASKKSVGKKVKFYNKDLVVEDLSEETFEDIDILLVAVNSDLSKKYSLLAAKKGVTVIDNSSAFRLKKDVPLIVPEVNSDDIDNHNGIISNPNCSTIIALTALNKINKYAGIKRMVVSTYQAVSGAGAQGLQELKEQISDLENNRDIKVKAFQYQIAHNLIPQIGPFNSDGYSEEEMKMQNEGRKIFHNPNLKISCTCVRVPVYRSHSESITIETEKEITVEKAKELINSTPGVKLIDDLSSNSYPMPIYSSNQDLIYVGRIRRDISSDDNKSLTLWCCGDQIRKGAATNAVQILEKIIEKEAYRKIDYKVKATG